MTKEILKFLDIIFGKKKTAPPLALFWREGNQFIRVGPYKGVCVPAFFLFLLERVFYDQFRFGDIAASGALENGFWKSVVVCQLLSVCRPCPSRIIAPRLSAP